MILYTCEKDVRTWSIWIYFPLFSSFYFKCFIPLQRSSFSLNVNTDFVVYLLNQSKNNATVEFCILVSHSCISIIGLLFASKTSPHPSAQHWHCAYVYVSNAAISKRCHLVVGNYSSWADNGQDYTLNDFKLSAGRRFGIWSLYFGMLNFLFW